MCLSFYLLVFAGLWRGLSGGQKTCPDGLNPMLGILPIHHLFGKDAHLIRERVFSFLVCISSLGENDFIQGRD
jgi:hypothetical protein